MIGDILSMACLFIGGFMIGISAATGDGEPHSLYKDAKASCEQSIPRDQICVINFIPEKQDQSVDVK